VGSPLMCRPDVRGSNPTSDVKLSDMGHPILWWGRNYLVRSAKTFWAAIRPVPKARLGSGILAEMATCSRAPMMAMVSM
jgi:hypothetical protein